MNQWFILAGMRLTISLDEELYAVAKAVARAEDCSLSTAVSVLIRRALEATTPPSGTTGAEGLSSFPTSRGGRMITPADVAAADVEP